VHSRARVHYGHAVIVKRGSGLGLHIVDTDPESQDSLPPLQAVISVVGIARSQAFDLDFIC
jgi:hypothetical protein